MSDEPQQGVPVGDVNADAWREEIEQIAQRLNDLAREMDAMNRSTPQMQVVLPANLELSCSVDAIVQVLLAAGIVTEQQYVLVKNRELLRHTEAFMGSAKAFRAKQSGLVLPDGASRAQG